MIIIDESTVAVETEEDLQSALSNDNGYTTIYLAEDITLSQGITILPSKTNIVIDGTYPLDGTGTVQTYTDMNSSSSGDLIKITSNSSLVITLQNMNIVGRNYYGIIMVSDGIVGVTTNYVNVNYTGPQLIYNAGGYNSLIDVTYTSVASSSSDAQEVAEVSNITIGGNTTINHQSPVGGNAMFWFRNGSEPSFVINENSNVVFNTTSYCFYTDLHPDITIGAGANVSFYPTLAMFNNQGHYANSLTISDSSSLYIAPGPGATAANSSPLVLASDLTVGTGANVFIQSTLSSMPAIYFNAAATISLTDPQSFVLYCNAAQAIATNGHSISFNLSAEQINLWLYANSTNPGGIDDIADFKWYRYNDPASDSYEPLSIAATLVSSTCTVTDDNFTAEELVELPALTNFNPGTMQVLSLGKLLTINPVTDGQNPVSGTTMANAAIQIEYTSEETGYTDTTTAEASGNFSLIPSAPIDLDALVTISAHIPFLTGTLSTNAIDAGDLSLTVPSEELPFVMNPLSLASLIVYGRDPIWQQLVVSDTRVYPTPWQISATIDSDMTSKINSAHTLPAALIYVDENEQIYSLGSDPVVVFTNDGESAGDTIITWDDLKGVLLQGNEVTFFANEEYTAKINWELEVGT